MPTTDTPAWSPEREAAVQRWLDGEPGYDGLTRDIQAALAELAERASRIEDADGYVEGVEAQLRSANAKIEALEAPLSAYRAATHWIGG